MVIQLVRPILAIELISLRIKIFWIRLKVTKQWRQSIPMIKMMRIQHKIETLLFQKVLVP